jgi:hypothetical protein
MALPEPAVSDEAMLRSKMVNNPTNQVWPLLAPGRIPEGASHTNEVNRMVCYSIIIYTHSQILFT